MRVNEIDPLIHTGMLFISETEWVHVYAVCTTCAHVLTPARPASGLEDQCQWKTIHRTPAEQKAIAEVHLRICVGRDSDIDNGTSAAKRLLSNILSECEYDRWPGQYRAGRIRFLVEINQHTMRNRSKLAVNDEQADGR